MRTVTLNFGNGTLFMAGKKPNLSLDLKFEDFNLAFLSAEKDKITNIKGDISAILTLGELIT